MPLPPVEAFRGFAGIFNITDDAQRRIVGFSTNVQFVEKSPMVKKHVDHVEVMQEIRKKQNKKICLLTKLNQIAYRVRDFSYY